MIAKPTHVVECSCGWKRKAFYVAETKRVAASHPRSSSHKPGKGAKVSYRTLRANEH